MLILSQDKKAIHNFDNIISIQIEESNDKYKLYVYDAVNDNTSLGEYNTEKRAKEVLNEIIRKYQDYARILNTDTKVINAVILPRVYEMPEK